MASSDDLREVCAVALAVVKHLETQRRRLRWRTMVEWEAFVKEVEGADMVEEMRGQVDDDGRRVKRTRSVVPRPDYNASAWATMLRSEDLADHRSRAARLFRRRFRVPHIFFLRLVKLVQEKRCFTKHEQDASGREGVPVELKVGL